MNFIGLQPALWDKTMIFWPKIFSQTSQNHRKHYFDYKKYKSEQKKNFVHPCMLRRAQDV
jgi:hypothetical protein